LVALLLPAAAVAAAMSAWRSRQADHVGAPAGGPQWPPFDTTPTRVQPVVKPVVKPVVQPVVQAPAGATPRWVTPVDGQCPDGYPVKANDNSGIFHVPGGRFYERTVPERCYAHADDAAADGYRAAKA
jgi:hypothetical protein